MLRSWGRLDTVEKGISGLENRCKEIIQNSGKRGGWKLKKGLRDIAATVRKPK